MTNCYSCEHTLIEWTHTEHEGNDEYSSSKEYMCPNECPYPNVSNEELTEEELKERREHKSYLNA